MNTEDQNPRPSGRGVVNLHRIAQVLSLIWMLPMFFILSEMQAARVKEATHHEHPDHLREPAISSGAGSNGAELRKRVESVGDCGTFVDVGSGGVHSYQLVHLDKECVGRVAKRFDVAGDR